MDTVQHYIGGKLTSGASARRAKVYQPADGSVAREVVLGTRDDVDAAVRAAAAAFPKWAATTPLMR
ncbi:aldehyde dehydrogenase family protein, partial [Acidisoma sp. S159]